MFQIQKIFRVCDGVGEVYIRGVLSVMGKIMLNWLGLQLRPIKKVMHLRSGFVRNFVLFLSYFS